MIVQLDHCFWLLSLVRSASPSLGYFLVIVMRQGEGSIVCVPTETNPELPDEALPATPYSFCASSQELDVRCLMEQCLMLFHFCWFWTTTLRRMQDRASRNSNVILRCKLTVCWAVNENLRVVYYRENLRVSEWNVGEPLIKRKKGNFELLTISD